MAQRTSQDANLTLGEGSPKARATINANLALAEGSPAARVSQLASLVLIDAAVNPSTITPIIFLTT